MEDFNASLGPAVCRICMCGETSIPYLGQQAGEPLISPCKCSGTMGLFHRSCLEHWLTLTSTTNCEICKFAFKIKQKSRNFIDYIRQGGYKKLQSNRNPFIDFAFVLLILPFAFFGVFMSVEGALYAGRKYHYAFENRDNDENGNLEVRNQTSLECALFLFVALLLFSAFITLVVSALWHHFRQYKIWQAKNKIMFVVDQLDAEQSMHFNPQWKKQGGGWKEKIAKFWGEIRRRPTRAYIPEIARNDSIPIEPVVGISPVLVANFNRTSPDSNNTHHHDESRNEIPFGRRTPEQAICVSMSSTPQMYAEKLEKLTLSPIGLDDLFANSRATSTRRESGISPESSSRRDMRKTHSVYSVCSSFGTGVMSCSTPVADNNLRTLTPSPISLSTFKSGCPTEPVVAINLNDSGDTVTIDSQRGRFHVETLENDYNS
ncbi:E3 ubiquitin-protein ligase marc-3 [Caenorhabditis elegans]|uniref:E3 ubiquitin-protein ligase marc-3 n=1 Tax=Caenorhabditis elegans TaxID=6239 RepID=MARC3_CAEEL|nr:RING-CH-type domain-containing protein [Caenorhabditis elegans]CAB02744.2 RING-CH-type domain-containing protein [Caenorhabditis elegans]|eukprot:NP_492502.2 MARCH (Membrane-Associated Ring finger (C3HC4)) homolog [Caenorhabditis elegans]